MMKDIIIIAIASLMLFASCGNKKKVDTSQEYTITDTTMTYTELVHTEA